MYVMSKMMSLLYFVKKILTIIFRKYKTLNREKTLSNSMKYIPERKTFR